MRQWRKGIVIVEEYRCFALHAPEHKLVTAVKMYSFEIFVYSFVD